VNLGGHLKTYSLGDSAGVASKFFHLFDEGRPDLIQLGLPPVDNAIGGMFPGSCGILAAGTGVGKSSIVLTSALTTPSRVGIISTEDTPDVFGTRILSLVSGVDSLKMRRKCFSPAEAKAVSRAYETLRQDSGVRVAYPIGGGLEAVRDATRSLAAEGCKLVWLDYIQKVRGNSDDRRNEVSTIYTKFQEECYLNGCVGMVVSQFRRLEDPTRQPQIYHLKESGDLENEARLIILAHRDKDDLNVVNFRIAKCTFGGENVRFQYRRNQSGSLEQVQYDEFDF
jgi:replicative DNA helicase